MSYPIILKIYSLFFTCLFFLALNGYGQDLETAEKWLVKADSHYQKRENELSAKLYMKAARAFEKKGKEEQAFDCLLGYAYTCFGTREYTSLIDTFSKWVPILKKSNEVADFAIAKSHILQGLAYRLLESFSASLNNYERAIDIYESLDTLHRNIPYAYKNAAQTYLRYLDYPKAIAYFQKSIEKDTSNEFLIPNIAMLAESYNYLEDYEKAAGLIENYFNQKVEPKTDEETFYHCMINFERGKCHFSFNRKEKAKELFVRNLKIVKKT